MGAIIIVASALSKCHSAFMNGGAGGTWGGENGEISM